MKAMSNVDVYAICKELGAKSMKAPPSWTGWSRSRSAASPSPRPRPPANGRIAPSTSSIRRVTWISRPKSSAACACWTEPWRCSTRWRACSRNRKQCGGRRDKYRVPRICFINKMDRVGADFYRSVGHHCRPAEVPSGADSASHRRGGSVQGHRRSGQR